ncbi:hypothetical protein M3Y97_00652900 [Aphelenchoides bicaudatus]|nr:hypothetical protein M3Y97_00652900 [Aphelenchoides bicaudatus]
MFSSFFISFSFTLDFVVFPAATTRGLKRAGQLFSYDLAWKKRPNLRKAPWISFVVTLTVFIDLTSIFFLFLCGSALFCYSLNKKKRWTVTCGGLFVFFYILSWKFVGLDAMLIITLYALKHVTAIEDDSRGFFSRLFIYCLSVFASVMILMVFVGFVYDGVLEGTDSFVAVQLFGLLYGLSKHLENLNNFQLGLNLFLLGTILYGHLASALVVQLVLYWIIYRKFASCFEDWLFLLMQIGTVAIQTYYVHNEECIVGAYTLPIYVEKNVESSLIFFTTIIKFLLAEWYIHGTYTFSAIFAATINHIIN